MRFDCTIVDIDAVDSADAYFKISTAADTGPLRLSIQAAGLINAPILLPQAGRYRIISGFRRISACRALQMPRMRARLVAPDGDALDFVRLAISENALQRGLNPVELARSLCLLRPFYPQAQQLAAAAQELGLALNAAYVRKLLSIAELAPEVQQAVAGGLISVAVADELHHLGHAGASVLGTLFAELKIGMNKQREIMRLCREVAHREGLSIPAFVASREFQRIVGDKQLDRSRKTAQLRAFLLQRRMPALTRARKRFASLSAQLDLPENVRLIPPADFEAPTYRLTCDFNSLADLKDLSTSLAKILANERWPEILSPEVNPPRNRS